MKFNRIHLSAFLFVAIAVMLAMTYACAQEQSNVVSETSTHKAISSTASSADAFANADHVISQALLEWDKLLYNLHKSGQFAPTDFENLDFSLPGDPSYGDDPEWEFFNPAGQFKAQPISQEILDQFTKVKSTRVVFNVRRLAYNSDPIFPMGTLIDDLVAIIPDASDLCTSYGLRPEGTIRNPLEGIPFEVAPDNRTIVEDAYWFNGCVRTEKRDRVFKFSKIATRINSGGNDSWRMK